MWRGSSEKHPDFNPLPRFKATKRATAAKMKRTLRDRDNTGTLICTDREGTGSSTLTGSARSRVEFFSISSCEDSTALQFTVGVASSEVPSVVVVVVVMIVVVVVVVVVVVGGLVPGALTTRRFIIVFLSLKMPLMSTRQQYGPLSERRTSKMSKSISPSRTSPARRYRSDTLEMTPFSSVWTRMLLHQKVPQSLPQQTLLRPNLWTLYWQDRDATPPSVTRYELQPFFPEAKGVWLKMSLLILAPDWLIYSSNRCSSFSDWFFGPKPTHWLSYKASPGTTFLLTPFSQRRSYLVFSKNVEPQSFLRHHNWR